MSTDLGVIVDAVHPGQRLVVYVGTGGTCLFVQGQMSVWLGTGGTDLVLEGQSKVWLDQAGREALIALLQQAPLVGAP